mmetsp:Transcript_2456/g.7179  ORF Transcript_2456/g.7179 Transcript_2456/m.7179 type:complete len:255 (+) Transcript_2456:385-1149(+)
MSRTVLGDTSGGSCSLWLAFFSWWMASREMDELLRGTTSPRFSIETVRGVLFDGCKGAGGSSWPSSARFTGKDRGSATVVVALVAAAGATRSPAEWSCGSCCGGGGRGACKTDGGCSSCGGCSVGGLCVWGQGRCCWSSAAPDAFGPSKDSRACAGSLGASPDPTGSVDFITCELEGIRGGCNFFTLPGRRSAPMGEDDPVSEACSHRSTDEALSSRLRAVLLAVVERFLKLGSRRRIFPNDSTSMSRWNSGCR